MRGGWLGAGRWLTFAVCVAICAAAAVVSAWFAHLGWLQVAGYRSPFAEQPAPAELVSVEPTPAAPLARRVVLVIVEGLRTDTAHAVMPTLSTLRGYGADMTLAVPPPSETLPSWTAILTGAAPEISGVTTNGFAGREPLPTVADVVRAAGERTVVVGPSEFGGLLGVRPGRSVSLRSRSAGGYTTSSLVDDAVRLSRETSPSLIVVDVSDLDGVGRASGAASQRYAAAASRIDADLGRLVSSLQRPDTAFIVTSDHGMLANGATGGAEPQVASVPAVFAGSGIGLASGPGNLTDLAPTVSVLLGLPDPAWAQGQALQSVLATTDPGVFGSDGAHHIEFARRYIGVVQGIEPAREEIFSAGGPDSAIEQARAARLAADRNARSTAAVVALLALAIAVSIIGVASWRAIVAATAGAALYFAVVNSLFLAIHGGRWTLTGIDTSTLPVALISTRAVEAALASLLGAALAALAYGFLRARPKGPQDSQYLPGWLTLGTTTALVVLAVLGVQVAWHWWQWGFSASWGLPDMTWWVKDELDLIQAMAVGAAGLVAPLVSYVVGRYHPKVTAGAG